jgi:hypothetical protein
MIRSQADIANEFENPDCESGPLNLKTRGVTEQKRCFSTAQAHLHTMHAESKNAEGDPTTAVLRGELYRGASLNLKNCLRWEWMVSICGSDSESIVLDACSRKDTTKSRSRLHESPKDAFCRQA